MTQHGESTGVNNERDRRQRWPSATSTPTPSPGRVPPISRSMQVTLRSHPAGATAGTARTAAMSRTAATSMNIIQLNMHRSHIAMVELNKEFGRPRVICRRNLHNDADKRLINCKRERLINERNDSVFNLGRGAGAVPQGDVRGDLHGTYDSIFNLDRGAGAAQGSGVHKAGHKGLSSDVHGPWDVRGDLHGTNRNDSVFNLERGAGAVQRDV